MLHKGKLIWESAALNAICDICHKPRNRGNHLKCSEERKKARSRETVAAVKYEILEYFKNEDK